MDLWHACEQVGRQKRGLGPEYTICAIDLNQGAAFPSTARDGWVEAHIELGIKQPLSGLQQHHRWTNLVKVVVYPVDVRELVET